MKFVWFPQFVVCKCAFSQGPAACSRRGSLLTWCALATVESGRPSSLLASGAQSTPRPQHVGIAVDLAMIWCSGVVAGSLSALEVKFTDSNCQQM